MCQMQDMDERFMLTGTRLQEIGHVNYECEFEYEYVFGVGQ